MDDLDFACVVCFDKGELLLGLVEGVGLTFR